jgi:probable addiction module antidote protein
MKSIHPSVSHAEVVNRLLKKEPGLAAVYVETALEEATDKAGKEVLLQALRQVAKSKGGLGMVAEKTGMKVASVSRALSAKGNPTLGTLLSITGSLGLKLAVIDTTAIKVAPGVVMTGKSMKSVKFTKAEKAGKLYRR